MSETAYPAVPLILLALGVVSAYRGTASAERAACTVFWLIGLVYSAVVAIGVGDVDVNELAAGGVNWNAALSIALLIPALALYHQNEKKRLSVAALAGVGGFAILLSVLITGALSASVAAEGNPLRRWLSGLCIGGAVQRFEAVVSMVLSMGWFALISF